MPVRGKPVRNWSQIARSSHSLIRSRTTGIERKLKSIDVIDMLSDLFLLRGVPEHICSDNDSGVRRQGRAGTDYRCRGDNRLH